MATVLVDVAALALVGVIVWFFFLSRRREQALASAGDERQELTVRIEGGYIPEIVHARAGLPLRLYFKREETSACSDEVVFPSFGIRRALPAFETTAIDLPAAAPGTYPYSCGMDMMHGWIFVGDAPAEMPQPATADAEWPTDPVCGMRVDPEKPAATSVREGRTFYFCCVGCKERFENQPPAKSAAVPSDGRHRA